MLEDELVERAEAEHHDRVAVQAIAEAPQLALRQVLAHRQGLDVADFALAQVARGGVVDGVRSPPIPVGKERQYAEEVAQRLVPTAAGEERAMTAVVLKDEQADVEARGEQTRGTARSQ